MHADHFGPISESADGFKHIFMVVDAFSRFTWLFAVKSTTSKETIKCLSTLFRTVVAPKTLITDRGTAFTSQEFALFVKKHDVAHRLIAVAAPWANGLVERVNRFLKTSLKKVVDDQESWSGHINDIQYVINNTFHSSIKASPSKILFGVEHNNQTDSLLIDFLRDVAKLEFNHEKERLDSHELALESVQKIKYYNKSYYDERHKKPTIYKEGNYVLIRDATIKPGEDKKLKSRYRGPYMVAKVLNKNRYVIRDISGFNIANRPYDSILSSDRIKPYVKPVEPT